MNLPNAINVTESVSVGGNANENESGSGATETQTPAQPETVIVRRRSNRPIISLRFPILHHTPAMTAADDAFRQMFEVVQMPARLSVSASLISPIIEDSDDEPLLPLPLLWPGSSCSGA